MIVFIETCTGITPNVVKILFYFYRYDYIGLLDYDDMIVPKIHNNWNDMMTKIEKVYGEKTSYHFQNYYYFDEMLTPYGYDPAIPEYLHMMQHVYRSSDTPGLGKGILSC